MSAEEFSLDKFLQTYLQEDLTPQRIQRSIHLLRVLEIDHPDQAEKIQDLIEKFQEFLDLITTGEDIQTGKMHSISNTAIVHTNPHPPSQVLTTNDADSEAQIGHGKIEMEIHQDPEAIKINSKKTAKINVPKNRNPAIFNGEDQIIEIDEDNDEGFQTQKTRNNHKRRLSDEARTVKKPLIEKNNAIETKNKFSLLENMQDKTIDPHIPPVVFKRTNNYQTIIKRLNETHNVKCKAKPSGKFFHLYCETAKDHRKLTKYFDEEKIEYYVISSRAEKPTKIVIKGLPIDTPREDIKEKLTKKGKMRNLRRESRFAQLPAKKNSEVVQKKCANCGGPHTASYRGCPKFPKINVNQNREIQQGKSFASLIKKPNTQPIPASYKAPTTPTPQKAAEVPIQLAENSQDLADIFEDFAERIKPDIIAVQETHLRPTDRLKIPNYSFYSTPSRTGRGIRGTGIFVKNNLDYTHYHNPTLRHIEATIIKIKVLGTKDDSINIISTYISPACNSEFTLDIEALVQTNYSTILIGDLSAKHRQWNCERANPQGINLYSFIKKLKMKIIAPDKPTRYSATSETIIDLAITRNMHFTSIIETLTDLSSDHLSIVLHININEINKQEIFRLRPNWKKFRDHLIDNTALIRTNLLAPDPPEFLRPDPSFSGLVSEGPNVPEMMDEADKEILMEASPEFMELLRQDDELQANMRKILHDMEYAKNLDYVMDNSLVMKRLYRLLHQQMGKWHTLILSIPPNLYDNEVFKSTCMEFKGKLIEYGYCSDEEQISDSSNEEELGNSNDKNLVLE
ncbi:putative RNA-directed DNA polymerase like protein [Argiope bruennichi]|uniref:Putative RNA-directed DNA polymerase like protein n=1 Tax=Argiope bruennichi TaxID=94029 RepID=A0A8T0F221_ARGBR|nr:putative RNA-directed DNA polymerase like protein [Argiope bruennichi]